MNNPKHRGSSYGRSYSQQLVARGRYEAKKIVKLRHLLLAKVVVSLRDPEPDHPTPATMIEMNRLQREFEYLIGQLPVAFRVSTPWLQAHVLQPAQRYADRHGYLHVAVQMRNWDLSSTNPNGAHGGLYT